jgi:hypothetical protein
MTIPKFLKLVAGVISEVAIGISASLGVVDAGKVIVTGADGRMDPSFLPTGIGADTQAIIASEDLSMGTLVNIWDDAGVFKVRRADATSIGKEAHGFVLTSVVSPAIATIYFEGTNTGLAGLTPGKQFLSTTAGTCASTIPSATGNVVQLVGFATSETTLNFQFGTPVVLA